MLSYHRRTNQVLGVLNQTPLEDGLNSYRNDLLQTEATTGEFWKRKIDECLDKIKSIGRNVERGSINDMGSVDQEIERLGAITEYATEQMEILNNG